jgi:ectonucleotide pyrophosphatase/phosphodiesterase family protein 6
MESVFPTLSYPNYYSLVTGLYPESHGMVGNIMYDKEREGLFMMTHNEDFKHPYWWEGAEPLWVTATNQNVTVTMYRWPGCEVNISDVPPAKCVPYTQLKGVEEFRADLERALSDIKDNKTRLAMVYVEHSDRVGHYLGPQSQELRTAARELDNVLGGFLNSIKQQQLNNVNVIVVSDHGMMDTTAPNIIEIELAAILDMDDVKYILDSRAFLTIVPVDGKCDKVYNTLKNVTGIDVYKKKDVPERFNIKNNPRTPAIVVSAKKGYYIEGVEGTDKQVPPEDPAKDSDNDEDGKDDDDPSNFNGTHGYDQSLEDMRGIFYGVGPAFKDGYTGRPVKIVDIYNVMTNILNIEGKPNNGTWSLVQDYMN